MPIDATEPPAAPFVPVLPRRSLLKAGLAGAGLFAVPLSAAMSGRGFSHGVASGEPSPRGVLLWTRYVDQQEVPLAYEVSEDLEFGRIVAGGNVTASPANDHCAKAMAAGLTPGRWYYYRFVAPDGAVSNIGRTRTLPEGPVDRFRIGVFSCSNIGFGWFNAYAHAAEAGDLDLLYHAGDYFYEYPPGSYPGPDQAVRSDWIVPDAETVTLAEYRLRYAAYRRDSDLRRAHQLYPMIAGWDDHESTNDSYETGAQNHQPETEGDWTVRKAAAIKAYREWMPVSDEFWTSYEIGDLASIFRLETRLTARSQPPSLAAVLEGRTTPDEMTAALTAFREGTYLDPDREILGPAQQGWFADGMRSSRRAGKVWQVAAQQVLMGNLSTPIVLADALTDEVPDFVRERVRAGALASRAGLPLNMDAWDGYPAARQRVLQAALEADANFISLAGDTHNAWAFDLAETGERAGVEFGVQSVTSPGLENFFRTVEPQDMARAMVEQNRQLAWMNSYRRGYMAVELTPERVTTEYRFLDGIRNRSTQLAGTHRMSVRAGERRLDQAV
jgi:alkaline phosphatase D